MRLATMLGGAGLERSMLVVPTGARHQGKRPKAPPARTRYLRARTPRWESAGPGTGERPRPRQMGDGDGGASPIPDKSGTGTGERPRPRANRGRRSRPRPRANRGPGPGRGPGCPRPALPAPTSKPPRLTSGGARTGHGLRWTASVGPPDGNARCGPPNGAAGAALSNPGGPQAVGLPVHGRAARVPSSLPRCCSRAVWMLAVASSSSSWAWPVRWCH